MRFVIFIIFIFYGALLGRSTEVISPHLINLAEKKQLSDPIDRDTQLIWQYNIIIETLARTQDPRTEKYLDTLLQLSITSNWPSARAYYFRAKGRNHEFKSELAMALEYYDKAIETFKPANGNLRELAFSYVLKVFLLSNTGLFDEAKKTILEALPYAQKAKGKNSLCFLLDWYGDYYYYGLEDIVDNEKALEYYLQVNKILPQITTVNIIADNYAVLSGVYQRMGKTNLANSYFHLADSISISENLPFVRWGLYAEKARVLEENGDHKEANIIYLQAKKFTQNTSNIIFKSRLEEALWKNYKNLGNHKMALEHLEKFGEMKDQMANAEVEKKYAEIEAKYNTALQDKKLAELQKSKTKNNRNLLLGILSLAAIGSFIIFRKNRALSNSYQKLTDSQKEIEIAIYQGETQERQRMASDLHDNVNTKLAAARWRLEAINEDIQGPSRQIIDSTIKMLNEAYQDVRNISHNLVPAQLENEGLVKSIDNLIRKLNSNGKVQFILDGEHINEDKIKKITYPVYNIIFELINNVMKHADATKSEINLKTNSLNLIIEVTDNGQGYDVVKMKKGFGLRSINSRVQALRGTLNLISSEGQGTRTSIIIPFLQNVTNPH